MAASFVDFEHESLCAEFARRGIARAHTRKLLREFYESDGEPALTVEKYGRAVIGFYVQLAQRPAREVRSVRANDGTIKLLLGMKDGATVEAVFMPGLREGDSAGCISSQVGCAMGCDFCASTRAGLQRNLTSGEIVDQFVHLKKLATQQGRKLKTIVFMGMGEPMHNLENVIPAIRRIADPDMGGVGWRQVSVSTVGVVSGIDALATADLNVNLAVSLHAPDDATRTKIIPTARKWSVAEILAATDRFYEKTGRVPNVEYTMLAGVNDSDEQARELARLLANRRFHVNLIPYNPTGPGISGKVYERPSDDRISRFMTILRESGVVAHPRRTRGEDVSAACGQLKQLTVL